MVFSFALALLFELFSSSDLSTEMILEAVGTPRDIQEEDTVGKRTQPDGVLLWQGRAPTAIV